MGGFETRGFSPSSACRRTTTPLHPRPPQCLHRLLLALYGVTEPRPLPRKRESRREGKDSEFGVQGWSVGEGGSRSREKSSLTCPRWRHVRDESAFCVPALLLLWCCSATHASTRSSIPLPVIVLPATQPNPLWHQSSCLVFWLHCGACS